LSVADVLSMSPRPVAVSALFAWNFRSRDAPPPKRSSARENRAFRRQSALARSPRGGRFREKASFSPLDPFKNRGARRRHGAPDAVFSRPRRRGVPSGGVGAGNRPVGLRNHERASAQVRFPVFECRSRETSRQRRFLSPEARADAVAWRAYGGAVGGGIDRN